MVELSLNKTQTTQKAILRKQCRNALRMRDKSQDKYIIQHLLDCIPLEPKQVTAAVWPLPDEIDLRPLCYTLYAQGIPLVLPETPPKGHPLIFRRWTPQSLMIQGLFGTYYPDGEILTPQIIIVPLIGFDRTCHRLGYGGGYYDRTFATLPHTLRIGYANSVQEVPTLPKNPYDYPLSYIVTEKEIHHCCQFS
ncbi:MAG: 5-formyltetrahydrofolate cyclo-ligase [Acetobacter sp.]|nr:5-formyltetrahydrofolate cyclo-ligase [Acetobacter sp.]